MNSLPIPFETLSLSEHRWRELLAPEVYSVLRREATERSVSSPLNQEHREGVYLCAGCFLPLFSSAHKFESGSGWPSFFQPIHTDHIATREDFRLSQPRIEYHCARCGGHQGHVFPDGPPPTGQRWCNNGLALEFCPAGQTLPELRQAD